MDEDERVPPHDITPIRQKSAHNERFDDHLRQSTLSSKQTEAREGQIVTLDSGLALGAAHFDLTHKLPLADSIIYATAKQFSATIWTLNADFANLAV